MGIFKKKSKAENWDVRTMFGAGLNFATSEAYKLLRTNIVFSFPSEDTNLLKRNLAVSLLKSLKAAQRTGCWVRGNK